MGHIVEGIVMGLGILLRFQASRAEEHAGRRISVSRGMFQELIHGEQLANYGLRSS